MTGRNLAGDRPYLNRLALEHERCVPRHHTECRDLRQVGDQIFGNAVAEVFLLRIAAHVDERQYADRPSVRTKDGLAGRWGPTANELGDAALDLAPGGFVGASVPIDQRWTLDLVEGHWRDSAVDAELDELAQMTRCISFRAHPFRSCGLARPNDKHGLGGIQPLLDDIAIRPVCGQIVIPPDAVAVTAERFGNEPRLRLR